VNQGVHPGSIQIELSMNNTFNRGTTILKWISGSDRKGERRGVAKHVGLATDVLKEEDVDAPDVPPPVLPPSKAAVGLAKKQRLASGT